MADIYQIKRVSPAEVQVMLLRLDEIALLCEAALDGVAVPHNEITKRVAALRCELGGRVLRVVPNQGGGQC